MSHARAGQGQDQRVAAGENGGLMKTLIILIAIAALAACNREGPAEKAGRQVDRAADKAAQGINNAGDNVRDAVNGKK